MDRQTQERLINWGYAVTDAAVRSLLDQSPPKGSLPYPGTPI
jgi:NTE family protein